MVKDSYSLTTQFLGMAWTNKNINKALFLTIALTEVLFQYDLVNP